MCRQARHQQRGFARTHAFLVRVRRIVQLLPPSIAIDEHSLGFVTELLLKPGQWLTPLAVSGFAPTALKCLHHESAFYQASMCY